MRHIELIKLLVENLPYNKKDDDTWSYAWTELSDKAQESVSHAYQEAIEYLSRHNINKELDNDY